MPKLEGKDKAAVRGRVIIRTSIIGILVNALLAAFKAAVGLLTGSIAIVLDAVNNLSDALSSVITILGARLAAKQPDKQHPLGHGRYEYLSATVIAALVLYAGVTSLIESVKAIINPEPPEYTPVALVIVGVAVLAKILLGTYVKKTGERVNSESLVDSGADALNDSVISASTLVAAVIFVLFHISLEAYLGVIISVIIIKSGVEMMKSTTSQILGERVDPEIARNIKLTVKQFPEVKGVYDLTLHSYGPETLTGSLHVEVPDTMTAGEIDRLERHIAEKVYAENDVILTAVGIYTFNVSNPKVAAMRKQVMQVISEYDHILQVHGFYVDEDTKRISFDVIIDFDAPDRQGQYQEIVEKVQALFPDYQVVTALDVDISD